MAQCIYEGMMINIHTQTHMLHNELLRVGTLSFGANHIDIDYFRAFCFDANRKFCLFNVEHYSRPKWIEQFIMCRRTGRNINVKYLHRHIYVSYVVFDHSAATNLVIKWQTIKTTNLIVFFWLLLFIIRHKMYNSFNSSLNSILIFKRIHIQSSKTELRIKEKP